MPVSLGDRLVRLDGEAKAEVSAGNSSRDGVDFLAQRGKACRALLNTQPSRRLPVGHGRMKPLPHQRFLALVHLAAEKRVRIGNGPTRHFRP